MKLLTIFFLLVSTNAFAAEFCNYQETWEFKEALERKGIKPVKKNTNHKRYTFIEKDMIHLAVTLQDWLAGVSREEAIELFADIRQDGKPGGLEGEIVYYELNGKRFALVSYYPGDNEYGAFFELRDRSYRLIAGIFDSFIECR